MVCIGSLNDEVLIRLQVSFSNGHTYMDVDMLNSAVDRHSQTSPTPSPTPAPGPDAGPDNDTNGTAFRSENLPKGNSDINVLKY
ncbi:hypothetical protein TWF569_000823 [Orbilia oligospora]|uniref:Uncharacterized protein n=1 Tax=Orbilia oligospora TaxID=2813651 RepID=A0A7C8MZE8_ORBOL|nr:hypothetical protein TWF102_001954 [Orbilia oligospora]KAF3089884.1 hypothetical protein TWF706_010267 [Orbilia oligospora]KAF3094756.1 hypothetical protein TWF103_010466 [Orbilia oligospora]KAF3125381.1 hypothetical protein TWF569_000823 [Orbilia oligospora]KAF3138516.1 hypothetical protein TWF703_004563 [Orbilia oligospora]